VRASVRRLVAELAGGATPEAPADPSWYETRPAVGVLDFALDRETFALRCRALARDGAFAGAIMSPARRAELRYGPDR